jgi:uncharacterized integral membrane protein
MASNAANKGIKRAKQLPPRAILGIVIAVLALIFILQNTHDVQIHVLFWHSDRPLWLWMLVLFVAGFIVGSVFPWLRRTKKRTTETSP